MIQFERIQPLNDKPVRENNYVLYWMQASQRAEYNHALEYAIHKANELNLPVVTFFGITDRFPDANERHYHFMLEGLQEVESTLKRRGIRFVIRSESPERGVLPLARKAALLVTDRGYLRIQKRWRSSVARSVSCAMVQVETDVVVPVEEASGKEEYAAATLRPKIHRLIERYLIPLSHARTRHSSLDMKFRSIDIGTPGRILSSMRIDRSVGKVNTFIGGTGRAKLRLRRFMRERLDRYEGEGNDPTLNIRSGLSPYLHFGQISPLYVALQVQKTESPGAAAFLEQLIVRRELSMNFVYYNRNYDIYECLPEWAQASLALHSRDRRPYTYSFDELEDSRTHDPYWNAAQDEMRITGSMHGYMRMYWGKKILEWAPDPKTAFTWALALNNKYELDGRDPNGFAGVAWCFGKHDRPWKEREVFGKVRYMNDSGLKRKFNIGRYVEMIQKMKIRN
ncbi:MAG: deoxyribodipyrimidine photo-lyase [bacterium]|nr:MAG: deoxyribodipyrimidine photo-lyase [bacterium]